MIAALLWGLSGVAHAEETAERRPGEVCLDAVGFRALVIDAQAALDRGDVPLAAEVLGQWEKAAPCLGYAPERRLWADLLVVYAIVAFNQKGDWQGPLGTALRLRPMVDRVVGRGHPMHAWEPGPERAPAELPVLKPGQQLFVDGDVATALPTDGWHLVQKFDGTYWETEIAKGAPPADAWLITPVERPVVLEWWVGGHVHLGGMVASQGGGAENWGRPALERFSDYHDLPEDGLLSWGFNGALQATVRRVGVSLRGGTVWNDGPGTQEAHVSLVGRPGGLTLGLGMSFTNVAWRQTAIRMRGREPAVDKDGYYNSFAPQYQSELQRFPHVEVGLKVPMFRRFAWEGSLIVGSNRAAFTVFSDGWVTLPPATWLGRGVRPRLGGVATLTAGRLTLAEEPSYHLDAVLWRFTPSAGIVYGAY